MPGDLLDQGSLRRHPRRAPPDRGLQPRGAELRDDELHAAGAHRRRDRARRGAHARGDPPRRSRHPLLPGELVGDVRQGAGGAADRAHAVLSALAVRRGEGVRALDHGQLPRELRPVRGERHPLQPRLAAPRPRVRRAQGEPRRRAHQARARHRAAARQPRRAPRLGLRGRLRGVHVADAAARRARRLRGRERRDALDPRAVRDRVRPRRPRLERLRRAGRPLLPPRRGRPAHRRPGQGARGVRLEAAHELRRRWSR